MYKEFNDKVVLVTGGSTGIGRTTAIEFAKYGSKVVIASRRNVESEETISQIKDIGGEACFYKSDVSKSNEVEDLIKYCIRTYGSLNYAFNNAGIEGTGFVPIIDYDEDIWDKVISINLKGVWLSMKYQIPEILKAGGGAIVNMSSVAGLKGGSIGTAYIASKHGVIGLTKAAASEYASQGIRVNSVCPALIETPMADRLIIEKEDISKNYPIGRIGKPVEIASPVLWLCSDSASFVTGHSMVIDGGLLL